MSTLEEEVIKQEMREHLRSALPLQPRPSTTISQQQHAELAAAGVTISDGRQVVIHISRPRYVVQIPPGLECISEAQAVALRDLVRSVVDAHRAPFQSVWTLLNQYMGVTSYRLTPAASAPRAVAFLEHWRDTGLPPS